MGLKRREMMNWTPEQDAIVRQAYENGDRLKDVADANGWTRNQLIGRARRLGLCKAGRQLESPHSGAHTFYPMSPEARARTTLAAMAGIAKWRSENPQRVLDIMAAARAARRTNKNSE